MCFLEFRRKKTFLLSLVIRVPVICLPTNYLGVLRNSFKRVRASQIELEFASVVFWGEGRTGVPGEKLLGTRERTNNPGQIGGRRALSPLRHPFSPNSSGNGIQILFCTMLLTRQSLHHWPHVKQKIYASDSPNKCHISLILSPIIIRMSAYL